MQKNFVDGPVDVIRQSSDLRIISENDIMQLTEKAIANAHVVAVYDKQSPRVMQYLAGFENIK